MPWGSRVKAVALAFAVLTAACGGGDDDEKEPTLGSGAPAEETTTTTVPGDVPLGEVRADGSVSAGGGAGAPAGVPAGAPTTVARSGGGGPTTTAKAGSSPQAASSKTASPGRYTYRRTGKQTSPFGERSLNGEGSLTVDPPNGGDQHSATRYTESGTQQTLRHRAGGIDLLYLKIENDQVGSFEFRPSPAALFAPDPLAVGATWSWRMTSTNGALTVDASFKVVATETLTIGGEAVATSVVEGTSQLSGAFTGTLKQKLWGSDRYRLIVRSDEVTDLTAPAAVRSESQSVLTSTKPG